MNRTWISIKLNGKLISFAVFSVKLLKYFIWKVKTNQLRYIENFNFNQSKSLS